jgi:MFS family permease
VLLGGLTTITVALLLLSRAGAQAAYFPGIFAPFLLLGLGAGTAFLPLTTLAMEDVPARDAGLASGIVNASIQVSAAVGIAVLGTIATSRTHALTQAGDSLANALTGGYHLAFEIGAGSVVVGALVALTVLRSGRGPRTDEVVVSRREAEPEAA